MSVPVRAAVSGLACADGARVGRYTVEGTLRATPAARYYRVRDEQGARLVLCCWEGAGAAVDSLGSGVAGVVPPAHASSPRPPGLRNWIGVIELLALDGGPAAVLERVDGPTLAELRAAGTVLDLADVDALGGGILAGMAALHDAGGAHGQLDAHAVWLPDGPRAPRLAPGEPGRPRPERVAADLRALGALLSELLDGRVVPERMREAVRRCTGGAAVAGEVAAVWGPGGSAPATLASVAGVARAAVGDDHLPLERLDARHTPAELAHLAGCSACRVARLQLVGFGSLAEDAGDGPPGELPPGATVGDRYVVERCVGAGATGRVYLARHRVLGSRFALKVLAASGPRLRDRLLREGVVQSRLEHPNVVRVVDVVEVGSALGLVMEFVAGPWPTLAALIGQGALGPPADGDWSLHDRLARGIIHGVRAAHALGWVHRDLKPANILVAAHEDGPVPKIADFGLARVLGDEASGLTRPGSVLGTPAYMAPEQLDDPAAVDARADVFALGAILYELVTGRRAFDGGSLGEVTGRIAAGRYVPPRELVPGLPARMERAIVGALEVDRERRFPTCSALLAAWEGEGTAVAPSSARGRAAAAIGAALALAVVAAGVLAGPVGAPVAVGEAPPSDPAVRPRVAASGEGPASEPVPVGAEAGAPASDPAVRRRVSASQEAPPEHPNRAPARVDVRGDAADVQLRDEGGALRLVGEVPAGRYRIVARFGGDPEIDAGELVVVPGDAATIRCDARFTRCKVERP